jgi:hypothetical protein
LAALHPAQVKREQRHRVGLVVGHAHPAAAVEVIARYLAAVDARYEADVLGQQVDTVVVWMRKADLELARQVLCAVDRLFRIQRRDLLSVVVGEEHLVVGRTPRRHLARHRVSQFARVERQLGVQIVDRARDRITVDVAARAERGQLVAVIAVAAVEMANQRTQMVPAHVMELDALARGKPDAAVRIALGGRVEREPLRGRQLAARGILDPHHEDEVAVLLAAFVALALFVDAEMLGDFLGLLVNRLGLARAQRVDLRAHRMTAVVPRLDVEQPLARMLEALDGRHFRHARAFERYRRSAAWMIGFHWCDSCRAHGSGASEWDRLVK